MRRHLVHFLRRLLGLPQITERIEALMQSSSRTDVRLDIIGNELHAIREQLGNLDVSLERLSPSEEDGFALSAELKPYAGLSAPLYIREDGSLALSREQGNSSERSIVISIPKSGTYLLGAYLQSLGMIHCFAHVHEGGFSDYRGRSIKEMVENYTDFEIPLPVEHTLKLVKPGDFVVGHLRDIDRCRPLLSEFRKVLAVREIRAALVSHMRFMNNEGRGKAFGTDWKNEPDPRQKMLGYLRKYAPTMLPFMAEVAAWRQLPDVLVVPFDALLGDHGPELQQSVASRIAGHVGVDLTPAEAVTKLRGVIGKPTTTWSGSRTSLQEYWSPECEEIFRDHGGGDLNLALGYDAAE